VALLDDVAYLVALLVREEHGREGDPSEVAAHALGAVDLGIAVGASVEDEREHQRPPAQPA
jgi:hypothetical protein